MLSKIFYLEVVQNVFGHFQVDGMDDPSSSEDEGKMVIADVETEEEMENKEENIEEKGTKEENIEVQGTMEEKAEEMEREAENEERKENKKDEEMEKEAETYGKKVEKDELKEKKDEQKEKKDEQKEKKDEQKEKKEEVKVKETLTACLDDMLYRLKSGKQEKFLQKQEQKNLRQQQLLQHHQMRTRSSDNFLGDIMTAQTSMFVQKQREVADGNPAQEIR